jgi:hypothetical protein
VSITQGLLILFLSLPVGLRAENPPAWVQNQGADPGTYPDARYLTGYGLSTPGGTEADQRRMPWPPPSAPTSPPSFPAG